MKKTLIPALLAGLLVLCLIVPARADSFGVTLSPSTANAKAGDSITFTVCLSDVPAATSGSVALDYDSGSFEYVSSSWQKEDDATLAHFDTAKNKGAIAFSADTDLNGAYFTFTLQVKASAAGTQTVSASVQAAGGEAAGSATVTVEDSPNSSDDGQETAAPTGNDTEKTDELADEPEGVLTTGVNGEDYDDAGDVLITGVMEGDYEAHSGMPVTVWIAAAVAAVIAAGAVCFLLKRKKRA